MKEMIDFKLKFGKYKGEMFLSTPAGYQKWLLEQAWFVLPTKEQLDKEKEREENFKKIQDEKFYNRYGASLDDIIDGYR